MERVVVNHQVQLLGLGCVAINGLDKPQPLLMAMKLIGHCQALYR